MIEIEEAFVQISTLDNRGHEIRKKKKHNVKCRLICNGVEPSLIQILNYVVTLLKLFLYGYPISFVFIILLVERCRMEPYCSINTRVVRSVSKDSYS